MTDMTVNPRTGTTRRAVLGGAAAGLAVAAPGMRAPNAKQQLPRDWVWDRSIKDFASLKQNVMKLAARKGPSTPVLSILGDIEQCRKTASADFLAQQTPGGWLRSVDSLVLKGQGFLPFQDMMIRQRDRISECVHLKQIPRYRFRYMDPILASTAAMRTWIETQDWTYPWGVGNIDMDTAYAMAFDWKVMGNSRAGESLGVWFDWHDRHIDPKTGFWDFAHTGEALNCMAGAMHQFAIYFMFNHELPYHERAVDATAALQQPTGLFAPDSYSHNCLDIDAVFILANIYNKYGYGKAKVFETLERAFEANLKCFLPEGGALHRAGIDREPEWWSTWCRTAIVGWSARILGIKEFYGPWDFHPRHPFQSENGGKGLPSWTGDKWCDAADWPRPGSQA